ncbi:MAG: hypothetical protein A3J93_03940 [Candidatus Magasanikbacteria bacterium RIFOXYC2_FULL_42_28]|uniref:Multifunctional fusion protein n=1 Tax=Candidatus Magasanikbacteria bacterium RIFOXYC2_FULL_42_28 TaxID=1798704 RepID=A0A1F6NV97_9BACT|nr:MAG: hypothetical protein A3J93_03940 [Candidatus Magasanikbacteria bacterium RIFOXYC2_FULL_42_28]
MTIKLIMANKYHQAVAKNLTRSTIRWRVAGVAILLVASLTVVLPNYANSGINWINSKTNIGLPQLPAGGFNLGLDLQGGAHLIYEAKTDNIAAADRADSVEGVRDVIERRVRGGLGVAEPLVQTTRVGETYRVIVELPGVKDVNQAIQMIGGTPVLEFKEENNEPPRPLTATEQKELKDFNTAAKKKANEALVAAKTDFAGAVTKYTEDDRSKNNGGDIGFIDSRTFPEIFAWAKTVKDGEIGKNLVESAEGYSVVKRVAEKDGERYVSASHILICFLGAERCDNPQYTRDQATAKIAELKTKATPQNFAQLARENSTEPGAADREGDLGKFKKGEMVPAFEAVAFDLPVGTISEPVETQFGFHLIYKTNDETEKQYQVSRILARTKTEIDIVPPVSQWKPTGLSGKQLARAEVTEDYQTGQVQVSLNFDDEGVKLFSEITTRNVGKPVAILLDGEEISVPTVNEPILSGSAVISGGFTLMEAKLLAQRLNSGALPVPVELVSQQSVGATLGFDSLNKSFKAGLIGLAVVILFMILYYRLSGILAALSLAVYAALSLAIFKLVGVTLTLSGIAGFVLSIGMAVDANVLVFERLKEELRLGKSLKSAMEEAFVRAWTSIRDSNITGLISCVFMVWMGVGFVQGFAVTLAIGILVSMFSAVIITRTLARWIFSWFKEDGNWLFLGHLKKDASAKSVTNIPFIKYSWIWVGFSGLVALVCLAITVMWGLKPGIDFAGGSLLELNFTKNRPTLEQMRGAFDELELKNTIVQNAGESGLIARFNFLTEEQHQFILKNLREKFSADGNEIREERFETVGASVSSQLRKRALGAIILVSLGIIFYIAYAFRKVSRPVASWKYGALAIVALIHDLLLVIAVFAVLGKYFGTEVDVGFVVALLTVLGYSVNDTIVVFDRVRENLLRRGSDDFGAVVNFGLNQTLMRSINTTLTTLLPLFALYFAGGDTIHNFSLALLIGIASGAYSSIFIASPLLALVEKWQRRG